MHQCFVAFPSKPDFELMSPLAWTFIWYFHTIPQDILTISSAWPFLLMATATATRCTGMSSRCTHCCNCVPHWSSIRLSASIVHNMFPSALFTNPKDHLHILKEFAKHELNVQLHFSSCINIWLPRYWQIPTMPSTTIVLASSCSLTRQIFLIVSHHTISFLHSYCHVYVPSHQAFIVISWDLAIKSSYAYFILHNAISILYTILWSFTIHL